MKGKLLTERNKGIAIAVIIFVAMLFIIVAPFRAQVRYCDAQSETYSVHKCIQARLGVRW